jgi:hypothetical protein
MERHRIRGKWALVPVLISLLVFVAPRGLASASPAPPSGWAVLIENDWYGGFYPDLPVGYINSTRMLGALTHMGWPADHILLLRDDLDPNLLRRSLGWLAAHVHSGDTAVWYFAGEYYYFAKLLHWNSEFRSLWRAIPTSRRVMIAETCFAERFTQAALGIPGLALPAVGPDEWDMWGLRTSGHLIRGGAFTYFLATALAAQPSGTPRAFAEAFRDAIAGVQGYFHTVLQVVPEALSAFHTVGAHPEGLAQFPNPHLLEADGTAQMNEVDQVL